MTTLLENNVTQTITQEEIYLMRKSLDDDLQPCYQVVNELHPNREPLKFSQEQVIEVGEETEGLIPVKLNYLIFWDCWIFKRLEMVDVNWILEILDRLSPKTVLELFHIYAHVKERKKL